MASINHSSLYPSVCVTSVPTQGPRLQFLLVFILCLLPFLTTHAKYFTNRTQLVISADECLFFTDLFLPNSNHKFMLYLVKKSTSGLSIGQPEYGTL